MKRYPQAEELLKQCLAIDPQHARAYSVLALIYQNTQRGKLSLELAKQSVALDFSDSFNHYALALAYRHEKLLVEAEEKIALAIRMNPHIADYFAVQAEIYIMQNRWTDRITAIDNGLEIDPDHIDCLKLKLRNSIYQRSFKEAETIAERLLAIAPNDAGIHLLVGDLAQQQHKIRQAIAAYQESLRLNPLQIELQELVQSYIHQENVKLKQAEAEANAKAEREHRERIDKLAFEAAQERLREREAEEKTKARATKAERECQEQVERTEYTAQQKRLRDLEVESKEFEAKQQRIRTLELEIEAKQRKIRELTPLHIQAYDLLRDVFNPDRW